MAHSGPPMRSRSLSREGSVALMTQKFHYDTFGLNSELLRKNPKNASPKGGRAVRCFCYPREGKELRMTRIVTAQTFYISAYTTGCLGETLQHAYCLLREKSESRMDMLACHQ